MPNLKTQFTIFVPSMEMLIPFVVEHWLTLTGAALSLLWVALEYRASMWLWPVGVILPLFYIVISWEASFIGNIAINVYYFITSIIGWVMWARGSAGAEKPIRPAPCRLRLLCIAALPILYVALYYLLEPYSSLPWADALSTGASVIGMLLLSNKNIEHWWCWMVANLAGAILFGYSGDYISMVVFSINFVMSILGLRHWRRLMRAEEALA